MVLVLEGTKGEPAAYPEILDSATLKSVEDKLIKHVHNIFSANQKFSLLRQLYGRLDNS